MDSFYKISFNYITKETQKRVCVKYFYKNMSKAIYYSLFDHILWSKDNIYIYSKPKIFPT